MLHLPLVFCSSPATTPHAFPLPTPLLFFARKFWCTTNFSTTLRHEISPLTDNNRDSYSLGGIWQANVFICMQHSRGVVLYKFADSANFNHFSVVCKLWSCSLPSAHNAMTTASITTIKRLNLDLQQLKVIIIIIKFFCFVLFFFVCLFPSYYAHRFHDK